MLNKIWMWILNNIFHIATETKQREIEDNQKYAFEYESINDINFNAIISNMLANYVVSDSNMNIEADNKRAELLSKTGQSMWKKAKKITSMSFGFGGLFIVPYVQRGKIYYSLVPQSRVTIDSTDGDLITGLTILAERKEISQSVGQSKVYIRWSNYRLNGNIITIEQKFTDGTGKTIPAPDFWKNMMTKQVIANVDRVLVGFVKSPINNRRSNDKYGVPITYGCDATIKEIKDTMKQIVREFELKEAFVGVDYTMFNGEHGLPTNGLYRKIDAGEDNFWEVFDPQFRDSSYFARLQELYKRLEHEVGTSYGIISEVTTPQATATEIRKAMYDTFVLCDDMRSNLEKGLEDFFYSCDVLANTYNLSPQGEYNVSFDWSYSLLEDTDSEWNHLTQGLNLGVVKETEVRQWIFPDETIEESEKAIEEIKASEPSIEDMLNEKGGNE